jgi:nucleoside-diphosphate-sugar epimerase
MESRGESTAVRCLVTGVAGFVGSHLAERLIAEGHEVVGVDAFTPYYSRDIKERNLTMLRAVSSFRFIESDLAVMNFHPLVAECDWIFHQAGQPGVRASWGRSFDAYITNNIVATHRLLEAAVKARYLRRFIYASSSSLYGAARDLPVTESTLPQPISPYGVTKLAAEHLCSLYWIQHHLPVVSLRYFSVYGPRQRPDMAFHAFSRAILSNDEVVINGDGAQTRDFTFVSDVVGANVSAATTANVEGAVLNIASGSRVSLCDAINTLADITARRVRVRYTEPAFGDVLDTQADVRKAGSLLAYRPSVTLQEGLQLEWADLKELYSGIHRAG